MSLSSNFLWESPWLSFSCFRQRVVLIFKLLRFVKRRFQQFRSSSIKWPQWLRQPMVLTNSGCVKTGTLLHSFLQKLFTVLGFFSAQDKLRGSTNNCLVEALVWSLVSTVSGIINNWYFYHRLGQATVLTSVDLSTSRFYVRFFQACCIFPEAQKICYLDCLLSGFLHRANSYHVQPFAVVSLIMFVSLFTNVLGSTSSFCAETLVCLTFQRWQNLDNLLSTV